MIVQSRLRQVVRLVLVAALASLAACGGSAGEIQWPDDLPAAGSVPPSPTLDPVRAAAIEEVLTVVRGFREAEARTFSDPPLPPAAEAELSGFLADPLLSQTLNTLHQMREGGMRFQGRQRSTSEVTELVLDATPPTARVRECVDASSWQLIFSDTGEAVPGEGYPDQFVALIDLKEYDHGWLVHGLEMSEGSPC